MRTLNNLKEPSFHDCLQADADNVGVSQDALRAVHPNAMAAVETTMIAFKHMTDEFAARAEFDKHQDAVDEGLAKSSLREQDALDLLRQATLVGTPSTEDSLGQAKGGFDAATQLLARMNLALRVRRDLVFCISDLLRLRVSPATGYLRLQSETAGLLLLMLTESTIADEWFESGDSEKGRAFHKKWNPKITTAIKDLGLYKDYSLGSNMSLHPRPSGTTLGIISGSDETRPGDIILRYQEGGDPAFLFCWFATLLHAHRKIFSLSTRLFPELDPNFLSDSPSKEFIDAEAATWHRARQIHDKYGGAGLLDRLTRKARETEPPADVG